MIIVKEKVYLQRGANEPLDVIYVVMHVGIKPDDMDGTSFI